MIQKGKGKAKKVSFVLQSPGRRKSSTIAGAKREFFPVISMSFKNSGIRRIVNQYNQVRVYFLLLPRPTTSSVLGGISRSKKNDDS
jgi:hypothetical protein